MSSRNGRIVKLLPAIKGNKVVVPAGAHKEKLREVKEDMEAATADMNPALLEMAGKIIKHLDEWVDGGFRRMWKMGDLLISVEDDPVKYEPNGLSKIYNFIRYGRSLITKARHFRRGFSKEQLDTLLKMRSKISKRRLSWAHVDISLKVVDDEQRMNFLKAAMDLDLTPEELDNMIRKALPEKHGKKHAGGRPLRVPDTYTARLENLSKMCRNIIRNDKEMWRHVKHSFLNTIMDVPIHKLPEVIDMQDQVLAYGDEALNVLTLVLSELRQAQAIAKARTQVSAPDLGAEEGKAAAAKPTKKGKKHQEPAGTAI